MTKNTLAKYKLVIDEYFINGFNGAEAYREHYPKSGLKSARVNFRRIISREEVIKYMDQKKEQIKEDSKYTLEKSIRRDLKIIEKYEAALEVLEDPLSDLLEAEAAERMVKFIGPHGFNAAQDRLSKQHGFYDKDNSQQPAARINIINLGEGVDPEEGKKEVRKTSLPGTTQFIIPDNGRR